MSFLTLDFETYYDKEYSLSKMTTEEYINDPRFEVIGVSVKEDKKPAVWFSGTREGTQEFLATFDWGSSAALAHHSLFDLSILSWRFGLLPGFCLDTLSMSRPIHGFDVGGSLEKLVSHYGCGVKGFEVSRAIGKRRLDFTPIELSQYAAYCINDCEITYNLFQKLSEGFPSQELELIHLTLLMHIRPLLELDSGLLQTRLENVQAEKLLLLQGLMNHLDCPDPESVRKKLCSNQQFAIILQELGVSPPMKLSPTTEKETFAFAKTDIGFIALEEHPYPLVQQLCSVRLGTKSTLEESRLERFLSIAQRNKGLLPVPLKYVGTPTLRWAGIDGINMQNLPSRDKDKRHLKKAIRAPKGFLIVNADSSQVEARTGAWWAGQEDLVQAFREKRDVYSEFATEIFHKPISKKDPIERFVGKESILSLQYGVGYLKLQHALKTKPPGVDLDKYVCRDIVNLYRTKNSCFPTLWRQGDQALNNLMSWPTDGTSFYLGEHELIMITPYGIRLPNGFYIRYSNLRKKDGMIYDSRKGPTSIWGGVVMANVNSALARIIVAEQLLKIAEIYPLTLSVHDSGVFLVSQKELDKAIPFMESIMSTPPAWAPDLPLSCEIRYGETYDC